VVKPKSADNYVGRPKLTNWICN